MTSFMIAAGASEPEVARARGGTRQRRTRRGVGTQVTGRGREEMREGESWGLDGGG